MTTKFVAWANSNFTPFAELGQTWRAAGMKGFNQESGLGV